ncbi:MAG: CHAT domain-containing protein [Cytophagaceae bacterium]|jgi:CHAT domain-containing protein|nr:CHAT domain-containing protein [Cytophagaceae bacterium]
MKKLYCLYILISSFCISISNAQDTKYEATFLKIEKYYEKGDYLLGLRYNRDVLKKIQSDKQHDLLTEARAYFLLAEGYELNGAFTEYELNMGLGNQSLVKAPKTDTYQYSKCVLHAIDTYISYGNYYEASKYIEQVDLLIQTSGFKNDDIIYDLKTRKLYCYFKQGFHIKAQQLMPELLNYRKSRIVNKDKQIDPKTGKEKWVTLSSSQIILRKRNYAKLLNLQSEIFFENGNYKSTDSLVEVTYDWIKKNLSSKDVTYVDNRVIAGKLANDRGDIKLANKFFQEAYKGLLSSKYKTYSREAIEVYSLLIPTYKVTSQSIDYRKKKRVLDAKITRYYGSNHYYTSKVELVEIDTEILQGEWDKVIKDINKVLTKANVIPMIHLDRARLLDILNVAYIETEQYDLAEQALENSTIIKERLLGGQSPIFHMQLLDKANYYFLYTDKVKEAEDIYVQSFDSIIRNEMYKGHKKVIQYQLSEVTLFELTDRFDKSKQILKSLEQTIAELYGTESIPYAIVERYSANLDISSGRYIDADVKLNKSLAIFKKLATPADNEEYAKVLETQARLYIIQGLYREAEKDLSKAFKLAKKGSSVSKLSATIDEIAILYIHLGRFSETEKSLLSSIEVKEKRFGVSSRSLIQPLSQIAYLYYLTGDYSRAEKYAVRSMNISKQIFGENSIKYAECLKVLVNVKTAMGDYTSAQRGIQVVIDNYKKQYGENHISVATSLNELALIKYYNNGDKNQVEGLFKQSLQIIKNNLNDNNPIYADVLKNISLFYLETNKLQEADVSLEAANKIWVSKFGTSDRHAADYDYLKGMILYRSNKYSEANTYFIKSKNIYAATFSSKHPDYIKALAKSGQMYYIIKDYDNSIKSYDEVILSYFEFINKQFTALSEREKSKSWNIIKNDFEFYYTLVYKLGAQRPELVGNMLNMLMSTKAILLNSSIKIRERILNSGDEKLKDTYIQWTTKKELLTTAISMDAEQLQANNINLDQLQKDIETLEKSLSESSELFSQAYESTLRYDWKQLKTSLSAKEVAVEIIRYRYFSNKFTDSIIYSALVVTKDSKSAPDIVHFTNGKQMETRYLKYYRNAIKFNIDDVNTFDRYWASISTIIPSGTARIYVAPDGVYNQLNLETIKRPDGKYLLQQYQFVQIANTKDILLDYNQKQKAIIGTKKTVDQIALFGNPDFYYSVSSTIDSNFTKQWGDLLGAENEVKNIYTLLTNQRVACQLYLNSKATEDKLKALQNPKFLHIATHGYFLADVKQTEYESELTSEVLSNPLYRSGVVLTNGGVVLGKNDISQINSMDGVLTAYEAMNLNLDNTDVVILSACETGLGDVQSGEGVYGLQRSFIVAGAQNVIMSLFKVDDDVTQELMNKFYENWLTTKDKRLAFIEAKKFIYDKYKNPLYWGAFVMIGLD